MKRIRRIPLSQSELKSRLDYDPQTGKFIWKRAKSQWRGREAGMISVFGYRTISLKCQPCPAHRIAWVMAYGKDPIGEIDHINGDRSDNRLCNLRCVTSTENARNSRISKSNTSGVQGVSWYARSKKWLAQIRVNGRLLHLGYFETLDEAKQARLSANIKYGFHPNHGRAA